MKKIIYLLIIATSFFTYAQDCNYKTNEVDEFTKKTILETKAQTLTISGMGVGFSTAISFRKVDSNRYLKLKIASPSVFSLRKGDKIMFKTDSENTIDLEFENTVIADYNSGTLIGTTRTPSNWTGDIFINISDEIYNRLLNENILKLRVYTSDGYVDDDVSSKRNKKVKELLKCI